MTVSSRPNLTSRTLEAIGASIVAGLYNQDNPFPTEAELCVTQAISRTILREAVKMLAAKGLVAARARQGTWVQPQREWNVLDPDVLRWLAASQAAPALFKELMQVRVALEPQAAALAAAAISFERKKTLKSAITNYDIRACSTLQWTIEAEAELTSTCALVEAAESSEGDLFRACTAFHVAVLRASGNRLLAQFGKLIESVLLTSTTAYAVCGYHQLVRARDYRVLLNAILQGNPDLARRCMLRLVTVTVNKFSSK